jgi:L-serine/L-threonine ammonia-lyase
MGKLNLLVKPYLSHLTVLLQFTNSIYIPSSDNPCIWEGNSTIIKELKTQLRGEPPAAIITPVGGGGLLNGIITGLQQVGWKQVPVIAVETHGSNSFQAAVVAGKLVTLPKSKTIAKSLSVRTISSKSLELSLDHPVVPFAVSDAMAADAVRHFAGQFSPLFSPRVRTICDIQF